MTTRKLLLMSFFILMHGCFKPSADYSQVSFAQVCPNGNPAAVWMTQNNQGLLPAQFDPINTGFLLGLAPATGDLTRKYVLANPYNNVTVKDNNATVKSYYQVINSVQPLAVKIANLPNSTNVSTWAIYLVPFFVSKNTGKIITDLSTISPTNKAEVWVAMFDSYRNLYISQKVSSDNPQPNPNPVTGTDISSQCADVDFPVGRKVLQVNWRDGWNANVTMGSGNDSFAISPYQANITSMIAAAKSTVTAAGGSPVVAGSINVVNQYFSPDQLWVAVNANNKGDVLCNINPNYQSSIDQTMKKFNSSNVTQSLDDLKDPSIDVALSQISRGTWKQGVYFNVFAYNNKLYLVVFDESLHVYSCVTDLSMGAAALANKADVLWTGSYTENIAQAATQAKTSFDNTNKQWQVLAFSSSGSATSPSVVNKQSFTLDELLTVQSAGLALQQKNNGNISVYKTALQSGTVATITDSVVTATTATATGATTATATGATTTPATGAATTTTATTGTAATQAVTSAATSGTKSTGAAAGSLASLIVAGNESQTISNLSGKNFTHAQVRTALTSAGFNKGQTNYILENI